MIVAADVELALGRARRRRAAWRASASSAISREADAANARRGAGEVLVDDDLVDADGLEDLRAVVAATGC